MGGAGGGGAVEDHNGPVGGFLCLNKYGVEGGGAEQQGAVQDVRGGMSIKTGWFNPTEDSPWRQPRMKGSSNSTVHQRARHAPAVMSSEHLVSPEGL